MNKRPILVKMQIKIQRLMSKAESSLRSLIFMCTCLEQKTRWSCYQLKAPVSNTGIRRVKVSYLLHIRKSFGNIISWVLRIKETICRVNDILAIDIDSVKLQKWVLKSFIYCTVAAHQPCLLFISFSMFNPICSSFIRDLVEWIA